MESKHGKTPIEALNHIRSHGYGRWHNGGQRRVVALGLNFTPSTGETPFGIKLRAQSLYQPD